MLFFKRKQKVNLEDYCRFFYDNFILNPTIADVDVRVANKEVLRKSIVEVAPSIDDIDIQTFFNEITLVRFELFSLAFLHKFGDKKIAAQSQFTKEYLIENNREDIWDNLESYNQAIAISVSPNNKPNTRKGQVSLAFIYRMRMDFFDLWLSQGYDGKCVARAVNRILSSSAWNKQLTHKYLMLAFCKRLGYEFNEESKLCNQFGYELNPEAQYRIMAMINGFYDASIGSLKQVVIK
jgi:hypothetical protein